MKNLIICTVFASLFALVASAEISYFYWGVNAGSNYAFNYATIKAVTDSTESGYLSLYSSSTSDPFTQLYAKKDGATGTAAGNVFADVTDYTSTGSKYLVELWTTSATDSDTATRIAWQSVDYSTVKKNIFTGMSQTGASAYTFTNFIPEPTSGLLLLLGSAALALRRKQKVA